MEYENREPLIYNSIYDKNAKLISNKKTFYHLENKIVDSTQYKYSNGLMTAMITEDVVLLYEYEFDNHKNWIKRSTKTENEDLITEEIVREIIYVGTVN